MRPTRGPGKALASLCVCVQALLALPAAADVIGVGELSIDLPESGSAFIQTSLDAQIVFGGQPFSAPGPTSRDRSRTAIPGRTLRRS